MKTIVINTQTTKRWNATSDDTTAGGWVGVLRQLADAIELESTGPHSVWIQQLPKFDGGNEVEVRVDWKRETVPLGTQRRPWHLAHFGNPTT